MPHVWAPSPKPIPFVPHDSRYAGGMPVYTLHDDTETNRISFALMRDIHARLVSVNPSVLVEFRQGCIGPKIRQCGNMIRASDCPGDKRANRIGGDVSA